MKKMILILSIMTMLLSAASGQKLILGEKAPDLKVKEWLGGSPSNDRPKLLGFANLSRADGFKEFVRIAAAFDGSMDVVLIIGASKDKILEQMSVESNKFYMTADPAGKICSSFGVQFVPYCVIVDAKDKVLWFGSPSQLNDSMVNRLIR